MRTILILLLMLISLSHCSDKKRNLIRLVEEWENKEILFPKQSVFTIQGRDTVAYFSQNSSYKILTYVDTVGCTSCRLKLSNWDKFIKEVDSLSTKSVEFYFFLFPDNVKKLSHFGSNAYV